MDEKNKRLFFAFEVNAPWPKSLPKGRLLQEEQRHMTVAFLGQANYSKLLPFLPKIPLPPFKVGLTGEFDRLLFLPERHPRVAAWHVSWLDDGQLLAAYAHNLIDWLKGQNFNLDDRKEFLPHVTIGRAPFDFHAWRESFQKLPMLVRNLHLYESLGQLHYQPIWTQHLHAPFEELEHTADIAFKVRGETVSQIFLHAAAALAFKYPEMLKFKKDNVHISTIDDVIIELNRLISRTDATVGCPFKAVSFHGEIEQDPDETLTWEMIVDV